MCIKDVYTTVSIRQYHLVLLFYVFTDKFFLNYILSVNKAKNHQFRLDFPFECVLINLTLSRINDKKKPQQQAQPINVSFLASLQFCAHRFRGHALNNTTNSFLITKLMFTCSKSSCTINSLNSNTNQNIGIGRTKPKKK